MAACPQTICTFLKEETICLKRRTTPLPVRPLKRLASSAFYHPQRKSDEAVEPRGPGPPALVSKKTDF